MIRKHIIIASVTGFVLAGGMATAGSHEGDAACMTMLATAIGMQLESEGFDMANACNLTVSELAQIKNLLETDGMGSRGQIQKILSDAAG